MDYKEMTKDALESANNLEGVSERVKFYSAAITDLLARAEAAEAENKRWSQVCEAQERRITELEARAKKAEEKLEAAVFDLLKAEEAAEETHALLDDEVHPVCDYSLYLAIHDSVSDIVNWQREGVWRNQKEESL